MFQPQWLLHYRETSFFLLSLFAKPAEDCSLREIDTGLEMGVEGVIFQPVVGTTSRLFPGKSLNFPVSWILAFIFKACPSPEGKSSYPLTQYPMINLSGSLFPWYLSALGWWHSGPQLHPLLNPGAADRQSISADKQYVASFEIWKPEPLVLCTREEDLHSAPRLSGTFSLMLAHLPVVWKKLLVSLVSTTEFCSIIVVWYWVW